MEVVAEPELEAKVDTEPAEEELTGSEMVRDPMVASGSVPEALIGADIVVDNMTTWEVEMEAVVVSERVVEAWYVIMEIVGGKDTVTASKVIEGGAWVVSELKGRRGGQDLWMLSTEDE